MGTDYRRAAGDQDCVIAVLGSSGVSSYPTGATAGLDEAGGFLGEAPCFLGEAEVRALGVLADAGMVPPLRLVRPGSSNRSGVRTWVFPDSKAS
jgi:hypothetical protein